MFVLLLLDLLPFSRRKFLHFILFTCVFPHTLRPPVLEVQRVVHLMRRQHKATFLIHSPDHDLSILPSPLSSPLLSSPPPPITLFLPLNPLPHWCGKLIRHDACLRHAPSSEGECELIGGG
ncbi:hypothetical protein BKA58DRAFT_393134 [Alternaria rosae]|uniref:uncharacterized protein n=1 Tax=Alternaria rosae TaxID=1187941 RepID=UPI001E8DB40B|nr:uncharacterized protein BKA58DRAFT_393134 [Alternaria rosae]KAH6858831.1 hypothetical protein BKA58DRAFT_393134 [Alternaria rosae]